jgi:predicted secreted protein
MPGTSVGTTVLLKLNSKLVVGETSTSFKSAQTMIELSNKLSGVDSDFAAGRINRTISVSGLASTDPQTTTYTFKAALEAQAGLAAVPFIMTEYTDKTGGTATSGVSKISGNCLISNVSWDAPDNDKMTFSLDLQVTGAVTVGTN